MAEYQLLSLKWGTKLCEMSRLPTTTATVTPRQSWFLLDALPQSRYIDEKLCAGRWIVCVYVSVTDMRRQPTTIVYIFFRAGLPESARKAPHTDGGEEHTSIYPVSCNKTKSETRWWWWVVDTEKPFEISFRRKLKTEVVTFSELFTFTITLFTLMYYLCITLFCN